MSKMALSVCADSKQTKQTKAILKGLQDRIGPQKFNAWFKRASNITIENGHVRVLVPNLFVANWIESHYHSEIAAAAAEETGKKRPVVITIDPELTSQTRKRQLDNQAEMVNRVTHGRARPRYKSAPVSLRHHLKDFVVGDCNRLAYSAVESFIGKGGAQFNPLFIHGPCGVGKTHLLQGVCNMIAHKHRSLTWRYVTGEQFTNDFVCAIRQKKFSEFRAKYRKLDLLAIDDVHFLAAKKAIQEEFLHTYNAIETAGNKIVLASDAHPKMVGELNAQLTSRFMAGMVVKIEQPDYPTRMEILRRKAKSIKLHVGEEILEYVAEHIRGSVRELEGTLLKLAAIKSLEKGAVSIEMARDALAEHLSRTDSVITLGDIEAAVAAFFGITPADIHSSRRTRTVTVARMVAMFLARRHTLMSYPEIGRFMGKNHSSVVLAVQRMEAALAGKKKLIWSGVMGPKSMPAKKVLKLLTDQVS